MDTETKILIIDDEEIVLKSCLRIFKKDNFDIETAVSGEEGLAKIEKGHFDIVITDLKMPGIGGMEVVKNVRANNPEITVIIFTGFASVETAREALKLGVFDYIPKPFTPDELRDVISNAIESRQDISHGKMLDLMAIVSHELKSPVASVHTTADTLYRGYFGKLEPNHQKIIESIIRNCQYLEDIIRSYIDLSKMEIDDIESFKKEIDLIKDVIQPVLEIPEYNNNVNNMKIISEFKLIPPIQGDPNLLKIVVTNLLNNAIKYGKPDTAIKIDLYKKSHGILFSIFNEGMGISKDDIENKLFKKFSRIKQKGAGGIKGTGLGLYISRKIIEKHNGKLWVESDSGKWVKFYFSLPEN